MTTKRTPSDSGHAADAIDVDDAAAAPLPTKLSKPRYHRMSVRLDDDQFEAITEAANVGYRKPPQELQRIVDKALRAELGSPLDAGLRVELYARPDEDGAL